MSFTEEVCVYCKTPRNEKNACRSENHFEEVTICEHCEQNIATTNLHDEEMCAAYGLENPDVCQECFDRAAEQEAERKAEDDREYAAELKSEHFHSRRMGAWS